MSEYCKNCEALLQENEELKEKMQIINDARITLLNIQDGMCSDLVDFKAKNKLLKEQLLAEREKVKELEEQLELNTANAVVVDYATRLHECKQALDEIEKYCNNQISLTGDLPFRTTKSAILDIISKAKGKINEKNNRENLL